MPLELIRTTHRPLSSAFLGLSYRILNIKHKQELLRGVWVDLNKLVESLGLGFRCVGFPVSDARRALQPSALLYVSAVSPLAVWNVSLILGV